MVYKYKRKTVNNSKEAIEQGLAAISESGISIREASRQFQIPATTIRRHRKSKIAAIPLPPQGRLPCLPMQVMSDLAVLVKVAAKHGFPFSHQEIQAFVGSFVKECWQNDDDLGRYLRANCRFTNFIPGKDWMQSFMRLTNLSLKTAGTMEKTRKLAASNPWVIYEFYDILEELVGRLRLENSAGNIWNVDESSFNVNNYIIL